MTARNQRLTDEQFFQQRKDLFAAYPTVERVDLGEAVEYHKSLPPTKSNALQLQKAKREGLAYLCSMAGTAPLEKDIETAKYLQDEGQTDLLSTVVDSMSRNQRFEAAERELEESEKTGRERLNGLPLVHYGVAGVRRKIEAVRLPVTIWGPSPDMRLVDEIGLAGGHTGISHGGGTTAFFHYTKTLGLETCIQNAQYLYRLVSYYEERGVPIQIRAGGAISCITPPSLILAPQIVEVLIAAEQGAKNILLSPYFGQGTLAQAVATVLAVRRLADEYLDRFGYGDVVTTAMAGYATNMPFPSDQAQAYALISMAPLVTVLSGAEVCYIATIDEAHKIPSKENNASSLRAARMILSLLRGQKLDFASGKAVQFETEMLVKEVKLILERVLELGDGDVAVGAVRAVEAGVLDQPFATNQFTARRVMGVRDAEGAVRYLSHGNLPFTQDVVEFHRERIAERERKFGKKVSHDTVVSDVAAISKGALLLDYMRQ